MQKRAFWIKSLVLGLVLSMAIFIGFSNSNIVNAHEIISDYTDGGYIDNSNYLNKTMIFMPEGVSADDRKNWETVKDSQLYGWYRVKCENLDEKFVVANITVFKNGKSVNSSIVYTGKCGKSFDFKINIDDLSVEYVTVYIEEIRYLEFFIPAGEIRYINYYSNNILLDLSKSTITTVYNFIKLKDPRPLLAKEETLEGIKLGIKSEEDNVNREHYLTEQKSSYELANNWFRFRKPEPVNISTTDIAEVETNIDGKKYNATLHFVIDENGEESLMLGRFKVNFKTSTYDNINYIEFCLPYCNVEYYNSQESTVLHTLRIGVLDSIKPIDTTFVKLKYDLSKQLNNDIELYKKYTPIFAVLGGGLIVCSTFLFISIYRKRKNK